MADRTDPSLRIGNLLFQNLLTNLSYKKKSIIRFNNNRRLAYLLYRSFLAVYQSRGISAATNVYLIFYFYFEKRVENIAYPTHDVKDIG